MDDKVNYTLVGAFVLLLGTALVAGVLWLAAGAQGRRQYDGYQSIMRESVAGLNVDAPVKYLGVDVGKVASIAIDPADSTQVRLRFLIERGTPVKVDTEAVLKTQGLTGIAYVELDGGGAGSAPLAGSAGAASGTDSLPTIRSRPSLGTRLESVLTTVLASVDRLSNNLNAILDEDNRAMFKQTLADTATLTHALAAQQAALRSGIADAARTTRNTARASERLASTIDRVAAAAESVDRMGKSVIATSERTGQAVDAAAGGVRDVRTGAVPALELLLGQLNQLTNSLQRLSEQTQESPNSLLIGVSQRKPGPGERSPP